MALITNQELQTQQNLIKRLIHEEYKTDREIIKQLRLNEHTFYDYKKRIQEEDSKIWDIVHQDSSKFHATNLMEDLNKCRMDCLKMSEDKTLSAKDRMEALKTSCEASANIFKLLNEGLSFQVSIPIQHKKAEQSDQQNEQEIQEDKPKEDKDLPAEAVPEHNNQLPELIPSGHEPWGTSLQRPKADWKKYKDKNNRTKRLRAKKIKQELEDNTLQLD